MKKMKKILMLMAVAVTSFTFTACDDDPWDDDYYWHDDYGWYDDYNHGGWGWDQGGWNQGAQGSQNQRLLEEAQTLVGDWNGNVQLSELASDGNSRNNYQFDTNMIFYQDKNNSNSLSGNGIEIDYATDGSDDQQTLKFSWYIDNNGDIYIKYASGATYVMDAKSSQYGFHLGPEQGKRYDTFFGYMIGIGMAKGDIIYIDLERNSSNGARASRSSTSSGSSFGKGTSRTPIQGTVKGLPKDRK